MKIFRIFRYSVLKTIFFNFKMLPFNQAIRLPILFLHKTRFINLSGKIEIQSTEVKRGMITIGGYHDEMLTPLYNTIDLKGKIIFRGPANIGCGCLIRVGNSGILSFGRSNVIGANSKIFCEESIEISELTRIGWEVQLFDTNFHYLRNQETGKIINKNGTIFLGAFNWIGNRTTIMKGTKTPDYVIVASNSLCNNDYTKKIKPESIIGGMPAKLIGENTIRIFDKQEEALIEKELREFKK